MSINLFPTTTNRKKTFHILSQRDMFIIFCAALTLTVRLIFPAKLAGEWFWLNLVLFFVFPALVIISLLKENLADFGLRIGNYKTGIAFAILLILLFSIFNYIAIIKTNLWKNFQTYPPIAESFWTFLWFQLLVSSLVFFSREFFFRGFFQLGLEKKLSPYILIFIQSVIYTLLFLKTSWFTISTAFLSALAAGFITHFSRSIYYSFIFLWLVSVTTDIMLIKAIIK